MKKPRAPTLASLARTLSVLLLVSSILLTSQTVFAWGKRGHAIVCQTAAAVLAARVAQAEFLKTHSFDLGYYCNVPDLIWKRPATYATEGPQHFMDLEIFERAFKATPSSEDPFLLSRADFEKKYPSVSLKAGRSYWRITELVSSLDVTTATLRKSRTPDIQEKWLVTAGAIGHYVGDLAQPLHVTENYDGVMSNQKGIHAFYEEVLVDELSSTDQPGALEAAVGKDASQEWAAYTQRSAKLSVLKVIEDLAKSSNENLPELLKLDRGNKRSELKKAAKLFEPSIRKRLTAGALALAEIWGRELGWKYNGEKFYNFAAEPAYIEPAKSAAAPPAQQ